MNRVCRRHRPVPASLAFAARYLDAAFVESGDNAPQDERPPNVAAGHGAKQNFTSGGAGG